jgi:hypothetical protein
MHFVQLVEHGDPQSKRSHCVAAAGFLQCSNGNASMRNRKLPKYRERFIEVHALAGWFESTSAPLFPQCNTAKLPIRQKA